MGIPKFFRWLSERYPLINQTITGNMLPPEFDNLYLDMNGIIHNCTHPNNGEENFLARLTEKEMVLGIFHYIDRLFHMVKPKKVFYLAVDGVAPRAKLNQQRQRRFRSAKDRREALEAAEAKGIPIPAEKPFDSNCITPGTEFMTNLSSYLKFFIRKKIQEDANWRRCKVIFSGHEVPGEGEHKIMEYIRHMKSQPDWDPNTSHCLYGLDADLIMLGLTTHEPHFSLLREDVLTKMGRNQAKDPAGKSFHLLHLSLVREYLDLEFSSLRNTLTFQYDLERIIDDFVLMCFFVGNDFLPNLPGQDIAEGTFNTMFEKYKQTLPSLGGYLTEYANINFDRLEKFIAIISEHERAMFEIVPLGLDKLTDGPSQTNNNNADVNGRKQLTASQQKRLERDLKSLGVSDGSYSDEDDESWKENYYKDKFRKQLMEEKDFHKNVLESYIQGIVWVLNYYHHGCISWGWFYPYLYAPLGSDLKNLSKLKITFDFGQPFLPFLQLMAVLPQDSSDFLPEPFRQLMCDPNSPIYDYYPKDFTIDLNGKQNAWEGVALIPFVDQAKLVAVCSTINPATLTEDERRRNSFGDAHSYQHNSNTKYICKTPLPDVFTDIQDCTADEQVYSLPPFPTGNHLGFKLCNGVRMGLQSPAGFPTLQGIPFTPVLRFLHVNIFGSNSRKESLTLKVAFDDSLDALTIIDRARPLLGSTCYLNWPYFREAMVTGLSYEYGQAATDGDFSFNRSDTDAWRKESEYIQTNLLLRKAVDIVALPVLLHARVFEKMEETPDGKMVKTWAQQEELVPIQLVVKSILVTDPRYLEQGPLQFAEKFPVGQKIVYTGPEHYGAVGEVLEVDKSGSRFRIMVQPQPIPHFGKQIASQLKDNYYTFDVAAKMLGISNRTLAKITGRVPVDPGNQNIGLNMKFSGKNEQIIGYSRRIGSQWEFSDKAMAILAEYMKKFPAVFRMLELKPDAMAYNVQELYAEFARDQPPPSNAPKQLIDIPLAQPPAVVKSSPQPARKEVIPDEAEIIKTSSDQVAPIEVIKAAKPGKGEGVPKDTEKDEEEEEEDVELPNDENAKKLKEIKTWIKSLEMSKLNRVPTGSMGLSKDGIAKVEEEATKWAQGTEAQHRRAAVLHAVSPDNLVKPGTLAEYPRAYLGDRIIVVAENTPLPFGAYGTIVAVKGEYADVIFDKQYIGATSLNKNCSDLRGACLPLHSLLNLTQGWAQMKKGSGGFGQRAYNGEREDNRESRSADYHHHPRHHNQDNRGNDRYQRDNRGNQDNRNDRYNQRDNRNRDERDNRNYDRTPQENVKILNRSDKPQGQSPSQQRPQQQPQQQQPRSQVQQPAPQPQVQSPQVQAQQAQQPQGIQQGAPRQSQPRNDKRNVMRQSNQGVNLNVQPQPSTQTAQPVQPTAQPGKPRRDEEYDPTAYWNSLQQQYQPQATPQFPQGMPLQPPPSYGNVQLPPFANDPYMMQQYMTALQQQYQQLALQMQGQQGSLPPQPQQQFQQPQFNQQDPQQFQQQPQSQPQAESQGRNQELNWQQRELLQKGNRRNQPRNDNNNRKPKQQGAKNKSQEGGSWQPKDQMKKSM